MTVQEWVNSARSELETARFLEAKSDAQLLAGFGLGKDRAWLIAHQDDRLEDAAITLLDTLLARRLKHEPIAYIIGSREFYGRRFQVNPSVLIPRQETEHLIEFGLKRLPQQSSVLDIGTGSGCIATTLKLERPDLSVTACDISSEALLTAQSNAKSLGAPVHFVQSDLVGAFGANKFDCIVSNPPYVADNDPLLPEVREWEPAGALFAGTHGLDIYCRLAVESPSCLRPSGVIIMEIGAGQHPAITQIFLANGWQPEASINDLAGIVRILAFRRP